MGQSADAMRLLSLSLLCAIALSSPAQATPAAEFEIIQVNPIFSVLTLKTNDHLTILQVLAKTDITINGAKATFKNLAPHMTVKVTLAQPGVAQRLEATGVITSPAAAPQPPLSPGSTGHP